MRLAKNDKVSRKTYPTSIASLAGPLSLSIKVPNLLGIIVLRRVSVATSSCTRHSIISDVGIPSVVVGDIWLGREGVGVELGSAGVMIGGL